MDRLLTRGHGSAVYGYGWTWFVRCLRAADAADRAADKARRLDRITRITDMRLAMHGDTDACKRHIDTLLQES